MIDMSNGFGTVLLILFGLGLIIIGLFLIVLSADVTSEEGLNLSANQSTPEGKTIDLMQNMGFIMGLAIFILGLVVVILSFFLGG